MGLSGLRLMSYRAVECEREARGSCVFPIIHDRMPANEIWPEAEAGPAARTPRLVCEARSRSAVAPDERSLLHLDIGSHVAADQSCGCDGEVSTVSAPLPVGEGARAGKAIVGSRRMERTGLLPARP